MKEKTNLDHLFQQKLNSFESEPNEQIWLNIAEKLKEKKKKRVIPFWWKLSGIAASLVLGIGIYNTLNSDNSIQIDNSQTVVKSDEIKNDVQFDKNNNTSSGDDNKKLIEKNDNSVVTSDKNQNKSKTSDAKKYDLNPLNKTVNQNQTIANSDTKNKEIRKNSRIKYSNQEDINNIKLANQNNNSNLNEKIDLDKKLNNSIKNQNTNESLKTNIENLISLKNNNVIEKNQINNQMKFEKTFDKEISNENTFKNLAQKTNSSINPFEIKNSTSDKNLRISEKELELKKIDSASVASAELKAMEELLHEKENKTIKEPKLNRWQLTSNVAPIYFSSASNGSPIDDKFKTNTKSFNTNIGYGVGVKYAVNKKVKIRTGINNLVADYNTNDIVAYQNNVASRLSNVKTNLRGSMMQIENKNKNEMPTLTEAGNVLKKFDGSLNQKIGYIEVPLEMSYKIVDRKFGLEVIGGVSSLFLNQNEVSLQLSDQQMIIGQANNLNSIHFSGNVGLGIKYNFWKRIEANIEPLFKYQVNTFNDNSGNFKPYIFGVYSGVSYTF